MKVWSKTILSVYKYLEALSNAIDKLVVKKSINSAFYTNGRNNTCYDCATKIMRLTERKVNLINLKVLVEDVLSSMPKLYKRIIVLCYIDGITSEEISKLLNISMRTFFRKKIEAFDSFTKTLQLMGYTSEKLERMFYGENWLNSLYRRNQEEEKYFYKDNVEMAENKFFKSVVREFNMV